MGPTGIHAITGSSQLFGQKATDDLLDSIFSQFCIGK
jgi:tRNA U34 5-carboxymethylaminomethyl modifying GTPase MnmE/TrmE